MPNILGDLSACIISSVNTTVRAPFFTMHWCYLGCFRLDLALCVRLISLHPSRKPLILLLWSCLAFSIFLWLCGMTDVTIRFLFPTDLSLLQLYSLSIWFFSHLALSPGSGLSITHHVSIKTRQTSKKPHIPTNLHPQAPPCKSCFFTMWELTRFVISWRKDSLIPDDRDHAGAWWHPSCQSSWVPFHTV